MIKKEIPKPSVASCGCRVSLDSIECPADLKKLTFEQLSQLAAQVRSRMIDVVSKNGGHLASSLGTVELIMALHYCFNAPEDKIVFDVGHQAYAHKILTGRNKNFDSLRKYQGITGFPCKEESPYDIFTTGHSSNAISLALGLVAARDSQKQSYRVAAVIGDGSLSGGLCFEGLNNAGHLKKDILIVLNTNELSIAPNVGSLSTYLNKVISLPLYNRFRDSLEGFVKSRIPKGRRLITIANKFEEGLKGLFVPGMLFEELGFRYFGPFDGHNLHTLIPALKNILNIKGPRLVHIITKKGKGYTPAENDPVRFHSAGPFEIATGKPLAGNTSGVKSYTEIFSDKIVSLAEKNPKIMAITAAMPEGTGLDKFRDRFPERFFDVGIAEAHAVCFAGGLAAGGFKPVVAVYSTFLQRAIDQIVEDVALQKLPVVFALDRAGVVGEDGATHQGIFDIAFLRTIPNLTIMAPINAEEFEKMLEFAVGLDTPAVIRYPKAACPLALAPVSAIEKGKAEIVRAGKNCCLIALGSMVVPACEAAVLLEKQGIYVTVINARFVKPLDTVLFKNVEEKYKYIFSIEEGVVEGGFGSAVSEVINKPVIKIGLPSEFLQHGKREILLEKHGLTKEGIVKTVINKTRS
ncbi:MAG: 1-deoxy-D-xylulose-5-phosphate synthase [Candidatus Omnitrophota bacterium]|jgi:1-deoxy-D-xylulose-5-phosphate synthase